MKNKITLIIGAVLCFSLGLTPAHAQSSSGKTAQKLLDMVVGTWTLEKASESNNGKISTLPSGDMHSIQFTREAKYIVRNQSSQAYDSGFYRANEDHKLIYLQSSFHPSDKPSEWHASIKNGTLTLMQDWPIDKKSQTYVYHRHSDAETARK